MSYTGCSILTEGSILDNLMGKSDVRRDSLEIYTEFVDFNLENRKKKTN